jgi:hypothetical protein
MARLTVSKAGALPPDQWPLWVLAFDRGYFPDDPVRQDAQMLVFREWQRARAAWFAEHGLTVGVRACNDEHRRRARVWQAEHPEDAGR